MYIKMKKVPKSSVQSSPNRIYPSISPNASFEYKTTHSANFLKIYFNFAYIIGLTPFRLIINPKTSQFHTQQWLPQKLYCGMATLLCSLWILRDCRPAIQRNSGKTPAMLFQAVLNITNCYAKLNMIKKFWMSQHLFLNIQNHFSFVTGDGNFKFLGSWIKFRSKPLAYILCFLYAGLGFFETFTGRNILTEKDLSSSVFHMIFPTLLPCSLHCLKNYSNTNIGFWKQEGQYAAVNWLLNIGWAYRRLLGAFYELLLLMCVLALWTAAKEFAMTLKHSQRRIANGNTMSDDPIKLIVLTVVGNIGHGEEAGVGLRWTDVIKQYETIKELANLVNSAIGANITCFLVVSVLDYAMSFDQIFVEDTKSVAWSRYLVVISYFGNACVILWISADICSQMGSLKHWFAFGKSRRQVAMDQLFLITNELDTNAVAIKGSGIFPITYSLVANILGITVTYFLICVQA